MKTIAKSLINDVLSVFGIPTSTGMEIYEKILSKRAHDGLEILLSEVRGGNFKNIDQEDIVSICARFYRDSMEGVAKNNLRLMAKIINGLAEKEILTAPTFLRYANILSSLSEEEIVILGIMSKHSKKGRFQPHWTENGKYNTSDPMIEEMKSYSVHYITVQQSLVRTGLIAFSVSSESGEDLQVDGGNFNAPDSGSFHLEINSKINYRLTPLMYEILRYTDF